MKTKVTTAPRKSARAKAPAIIHARPSMGDPGLEQDLPDDPELPDLDNETVHKTQRPTGAILEDDDLDDYLAEEHHTDRDEDVGENSPLHAGHAPSDR
jgi:hypothetical protein